MLRTYTMFMGPLEIEKAWNDNAVDGVKRFLDRAERVQEFISTDEKAETTIQLHKTIKGVSDDIEKLKFNTAVSKMMVFVNHIYEMKNITKGQLAIFLQLLAPFATKLTQEMRTKIGQDGSIHLSQWPQHDDSLIAEDTLSLPVQIGGKMR
ncbi:class I tRNA ligase family protein [Patescibacteria group bacterium]|nr:class I tRNA ligase family protein [Patescibacteria group bacterium]